MTGTLQIVVPMAGNGTRFAKEGFDKPKPLIEIDGYPMIQVVVSNLRPSIPHRFFFVAQREHDDRYHVSELLRRIAPECQIILLDGFTDGAARSVLAAKECLDLTAPLMIANSDQWVDTEIDDYLAAFEGSGYDGWVMTMLASDPKWSYVRFDATGSCVGIAEKDPVSDHATVGIYNFSSAQGFVNSAESMIRKDLRVNGEFYVAPTFDELVLQGGSFGVHGIGSEADGMFGLGIPADLDLFLHHPVKDKALRRL